VFYNSVMTPSLTKKRANQCGLVLAPKTGSVKTANNGRPPFEQSRCKIAAVIHEPGSRD